MAFDPVTQKFKKFTQRQILASLGRHLLLNALAQKRVLKKKVSKMKSRWQKSLEAAVAAYDTPMPWERGATRKAMISRRKERANEDNQPTVLEARSA